MIRSLTRATAAVVLTAAVGLVVPTLAAAPAQAAVCSGNTGVTVVVDPHALGGGPRTRCVENGGGKAASELFPAAGEPLTYVQRQPGMVCRVSGAPADADCVNAPPASAYWGLFWSDGKSGAWNYSTVGVGGLTVPAGGSVAFSWQTGSRTPPSVKPPVASAPTQPAPTTSSPKPAPKPAPKTSGPAPAPSQGTNTEGPSATPTDDAGATGEATPEADASAAKEQKRAQRAKKAQQRERRATRTPDPSPTEAEPTGSAASPTSSAHSTAAADEGGGGLPAWLVLGLIAALGLAAVATAYLRRRRGTAAP
ncbi:hypothetical protein [Nocardioides sp.]|uniref:hypothetical protein n=1 Tax=Nocardioides sp. TaxID=35761 RepID=UPI002733AB28|nr:hypothetical protein [Nocardioides sp.]MDP3891396.1 hypothetical protein [Nocardioides sp.]